MWTGVFQGKGYTDMKNSYAYHDNSHSLSVSVSTPIAHKHKLQSVEKSDER